jgi:hypothetical protein
MIKILRVHNVDKFALSVEFSDGLEGLFDGDALLSRTGPLLDPLRNSDYFARAFVDAGSLCWPNGLELSAKRVREQCQMLQTN